MSEVRPCVLGKRCRVQDWTPNPLRNSDPVCSDSRPYSDSRLGVGVPVLGVPVTHSVLRSFQGRTVVEGRLFRAVTYTLKLTSVLAGGYYLLVCHHRRYPLPPPVL